MESEDMPLQTPASLSDSTEKSGWQPIETAPHETTVLLFCRLGPRTWHEVAMASTGSRRHVPGVGTYSNMSWAAHATHWMPLPEPPSNDDFSDDDASKERV